MTYLLLTNEITLILLKYKEKIICPLFIMGIPIKLLQSTILL